MYKLGSLLILCLSGATFGASWENVLDCDHGAAVIDADRENRQHLQIVIRDKNIVNYFAKSGVGSSPGISFTGNEIIRDGYNPNPVYSGWDVKHFSSHRKSSYSTTEYSYIWRENRGLKIKVEGNHDGCPPECQEFPLSMQCESLCVGAGIGAKWDLSDWYFRDCR